MRLRNVIEVAIELAVHLGEVVCLRVFSAEVILVVGLVIKKPISELLPSGNELVAIEADRRVEPPQNPWNIVVRTGCIEWPLGTRERRVREQLGTRLEERALEVAMRVESESARIIERMKHDRLRNERLAWAQRLAH
jgi:hypothetical protein